jgi:hypothetical protein
MAVIAVGLGVAGRLTIAAVVVVVELVLRRVKGGIVGVWRLG